MFNVTVIKLKDIIKIIAIVSMIYILGNFVFKNIQYKNYFNQSININTDTKPLNAPISFLDSLS